MLYVINILYYLIADLDLLLVISCYSKLCYGVKIVLSQDEYLLPTTSKPLIYLCFLRSYNYTRTTRKAARKRLRTFPGGFLFVLKDGVTWADGRCKPGCRRRRTGSGR